MKVLNLLLALLSVACILPTDIQALNGCRGLVTGVDGAVNVVDLAAWNADIIRYDIIGDTSLDNGSIAEYQIWLESQLTQFDALIPALQAEGLQAIITLHSPPGSFFERKKATHNIFRSVEYREAWLDALEEIALRYLGVPEVAYISILNEPADILRLVNLPDWNELAATAAARIYAVNPNIRIFVSPTFGDPRRFKKLVPINIPTVLYDFHYYNPFKFVHQGAAAVIDGKKTKYPYPSETFNKKSINQQIAKAKEFGVQNNVEVWATEFAAPCNDEKGAGRYLRDLLSTLEKNRMCWIYLAYGNNNIWDPRYTCNGGDYQLSATQTARETVIRKYLEKNLTD